MVVKVGAGATTLSRILIPALNLEDRRLRSAAQSVQRAAETRPRTTPSPIRASHDLLASRGGTDR
jgi:hypothetical protein